MRWMVDVGAVYYHRPGFNGRRGTRGVVEDAARNVNEWFVRFGWEEI